MHEAGEITLEQRGQLFDQYRSQMDTLYFELERRTVEFVNTNYRDPLGHNGKLWVAIF